MDGCTEEEFQMKLNLHDLIGLGILFTKNLYCWQPHILEYHFIHQITSGSPDVALSEVRSTAQNVKVFGSNKAGFPESTQVSYALGREP